MSTYAYTVLEISRKSFNEINRLMRKATGTMDHLSVMGNRGRVLQLRGIALAIKPEVKRVRKQTRRFYRGDAVIHKFRGRGIFETYIGSIPSDCFVNFGDATVGISEQVSLALIRPAK